MKQSDVDSDGPELPCPYLDGVIKKYPDTATTLEYVRTINSQLRYDRNGYAEMYNEIKKENAELTRKLEVAKNTLDMISKESSHAEMTRDDLVRLECKLTKAAWHTLKELE